MGFIQGRGTKLKFSAPKIKIEIIIIDLKQCKKYKWMTDNSSMNLVSRSEDQGITI